MKYTDDLPEDVLIALGDPSHRTIIPCNNETIPTRRELKGRLRAWFDLAESDLIDEDCEDEHN